MCLHWAPPSTHTHWHTHPPTHPQGGWPPNQLKCYNTLIKLRYFNSVWRFEICVDSPTYGWVYGFVGWLMYGSFFWHLTAYLNRLSPLQGYFLSGSQERKRCTFLGPKHKSAIWDRTPPTYTSNLVYMCAGGFRGHKSSNRIELSRFFQELL